MHISELARNAEVNVQTIRFYERQGLLPAPARTAAGYRSYTAKDLDRVIFIKRNQELGFTLAEIHQLYKIHDAMTMRRSPGRESNEIRAIIALGHERLETIKQKIRVLRLMQRNLVAVIAHLETASPRTCPVASAVLKPGSEKKKISL